MANDEDGADAPDDATLDERIVDLLETAERPRLAATTVAERLDLSRGRVRTRLQALADEDRLVRRDEGTTAQWAVPDRVDESDDGTDDRTEDEASVVEGRPRVDAEDADFGAEDAQTETDSPEGMVSGEEGLPADRGDPEEGAASDAESEPPDAEVDTDAESDSRDEDGNGAEEPDGEADERTDGGLTVGATGVATAPDLEPAAGPGSTGTSSDPRSTPSPRGGPVSAGFRSGLPGLGPDAARAAALAAAVLAAVPVGFAALRALRRRSRSGSR